jgi:ATP-dependent Clp protease adaptor protein ClpS
MSTLTEKKSKTTVAEPPKYVVYLINDHYTTFDFVVQVLTTVFHKSIPEAVTITNDVHHKGRGSCGTYDKQIAETKVNQANSMARKAGFPLKCTMETE